MYGIIRYACFNQSFALISRLVQSHYFFCWWTMEFPVKATQLVQKQRFCNPYRTSFLPVPSEAGTVRVAFTEAPKDCDMLFINFNWIVIHLDFKRFWVKALSEKQIKKNTVMAAYYLPSILVPLVGLVFPALTMGALFLYIEKEDVV